MLFAKNQEQNESNTFKDIFLQPDKSEFILATKKKAKHINPEVIGHL